MPQRGWDTVTVPGAVAGWAALHAASASCRSPTCSRPRSNCAERGYAVSRDRAAEVGRAGADPEGPARASRRHFMPRGRAPEIGERFVLADAARHAAPHRRDRRAATSTKARPPSASSRTRAGQRRRDDARRPRATTAASGSSRSARTTAATRCTRSRPTARASPR